MPNAAEIIALRSLGAGDGDSGRLIGSGRLLRPAGRHLAEDDVLREESFATVGSVSASVVPPHRTVADAPRARPREHIGDLTAERVGLFREAHGRR